jgi:nucleoside-diphosphate-sugar epimerase
LKTAIVTGVAGFIGSSLAEKLLEKKIKVIGIDCFTDYYSKEIKIKNISNCIKNKNFSLIEEDLLKLDLGPIIRKSQFLFHEAAQPGVRASWGEQFGIYVKDNILATQKILEFAKESKTLEKIVMASSSSVYGDQEGVMTEDKTIPKPISPYGATKLASENLGLIYASNYNLPVTSLRYFTVYGPRQRPDMAFTRFIKSGLRNEPLTVYGDGNQKRDFTFIKDIVDANISVIENNSQSNIINIGGGNVISVNKTIKIIEDIIGIDIQISHNNKEKGDVKETNADISKAKKILGYRPKIDLKEGLNEQIKYQIKNLE